MDWWLHASVNCKDDSAEHPCVVSASDITVRLMHDVPYCHYKKCTSLTMKVQVHVAHICMYILKRMYSCNS